LTESTFEYCYYNVPIYFEQTICGQRLNGCVIIISAEFLSYVEKKRRWTISNRKWSVSFA